MSAAANQLISGFTAATSPLPGQMPHIRLEIVLEQILAVVCAMHFEIISARPFRQALDLIPAVQHFGDFNPLIVHKKAARRFVGFLTGVALDLDGGQPHGRTPGFASVVPKQTSLRSTWTSKRLRARART